MTRPFNQNRSVMRRRFAETALAGIALCCALTGCRTLINSGSEQLSERYYVDFKVYQTLFFASSHKIAHLYVLEADGSSRIIGSLNGRYDCNLALSADMSSIGEESGIEMNARFPEDDIGRLERMKTWSPNDVLRDIEGVTARIEFRNGVAQLLADHLSSTRE